MSGNYLAISNTPMQEWGRLYSEEEAMNIGTIFHDLNKPFFASEAVQNSPSPIASGMESSGEPEEQQEREQLMTKITQLGFFLDDLTLYLDTHQNDAQAIRQYHEKAKEYAEVRKQFAQKFYPLTRLCIPDCINEREKIFCWQDGPIPWEGACV